MFWYLVVFVVFLIAAFGYKNVKKRARYWKDRKVIYKAARPKWEDLKNVFIRGNISVYDAALKLHNEFSDERYIGMYIGLIPALYVRDPELIKQITIKDFDHFMDHTTAVQNEIDPLFSKNLLGLKGQEWREMRANLSPSFTSSKMRFIFTLMSECADRVVQYFGNEKPIELKNVDIMDINRRFTNDVIASAAFGVTVNSLEEKDNEFFIMGKEVLSLSLLTIIKQLFAFSFPKLVKLLRLPLISNRFSSFFRKIIKENIESREKMGIVRPDMVHLLLETRKGKQRKEETITKAHTEGFAAVEEVVGGKTESQSLTDDDITAQAMLFFFAGFENVALILSFLCLELAINSDIQKRLQDEIDETLEKCDENVTYEALLSMKYLDMVVSETLRRWPPLATMGRVCVKDYVIEPKSSKESRFIVEKDLMISMAVLGLHYDPKYFPEPEKFDPERFSDENKHKIVPFTYLPFGSGPRNCIGSRFTLLEVKILCFHLLSKFNLVPTENTKIPLVLNKKKATMEPEGGFMVGLEKRC